MKKVKKSYIIGFLLICLIGIGLLIGGIIHRNINWADFVETEAIVHGVSTRDEGHGIEYRPHLLVFKDENGNTHSVICSVWFKHSLFEGDRITIMYKKDDPSLTIVSNTDPYTMSYAFLGFGGALILIGAVLTCKYLYDVKRRKNV